MPVNGGRGRKLVGHVDADAVTFNGFDGGTMDLAVESPAIGDKAGSKFVIEDFLGNEVIDFDAVNDFPWQRAAVGRNDGIIVFAGLRGWQVLLGFERSVRGGGLVRSGGLHLTLSL